MIREIVSHAANAVALTWKDIQSACTMDNEMQEISELLRADRILELH